MTRRCPHCKQVYSIPNNSGDYVHQCNSGQDALDKEDYIKLDDPNWNFQGIENKASTIAQIECNDVEDINKRGHRKTTHRERQHFQYIKSNDDKNI